MAPREMTWGALREASMKASEKGWHREEFPRPFPGDGGLFFIAPDSMIESSSEAQRIKKWIAARFERIDPGWNVGVGLFLLPR